MFIQPAQIASLGFGYGVSEVEQRGQDGASVKLKRLTFVDHPSGLVFHYLFTPEEFDAFVAKISEKQIVVASSLIPSQMPRLMQ